MKTRVGVLVGGWGEEQEISRRTGAAVMAALKNKGYPVQEVHADRRLDVTLRRAKLDVAFIALHGRVGEDGGVQGLLEVMGLPYTGSGVLASALAMNKAYAKQLFQLQNLPTPRGYQVPPGADPLPLHADLGFPCVVKPTCGGSSVGLAVVTREADLAGAVRHAAAFGGHVTVERLVRGREISVGIVDGKVLGSCEMVYRGDTFDYRSKYRPGTQYFLPPRLPPTRVANLEALGLAAYRALGCRGYGRVDLLSSERDNDFLLEVNTLPAFTATSLLPKMARQAGLPFEDLVETLVLLATTDATAAMAPSSEPARVAHG